MAEEIEVDVMDAQGLRTLKALEQFLVVLTQLATAAKPLVEAKTREIWQRTK